VPESCPASSPPRRQPMIGMSTASFAATMASRGRDIFLYARSPVANEETKASEWKLGHLASRLISPP